MTTAFDQAKACLLGVLSLDVAESNVLAGLFKCGAGSNMEEQEQFKIAMACLLACLQLDAIDDEKKQNAQGKKKSTKNWAWLGVYAAGDGHTKKLNTLQAIDRAVSTKIPTSSELASGNKENKFSATEALGAYQGLKDKAEKDALWRVSYLLKSALVWFILLFYALGCAVCVFGGLCEKFLKGIKGLLDPLDAVHSPKDFAMALVLPSLGVLSLASLSTNVRIMKADVEDFVNGIIYWCKGHGTDRSPAIKMLVFVISLCTGIVFGLMAWHYTDALFTAFSFSIPGLGMAFAIGGFVTEGMLTYGLVTNYWVSFIASVVNGAAYENFKRNYLCDTAGKEFTPLRKAMFFTILTVLAAVVVFGMVAVCSSGLAPFADFSWLAVIPEAVSFSLLVLAVLAQLPLYLVPCLAFSKHITQSSETSRNALSIGTKLLAAWNGCKVTCSTAMNSLGQAKLRFMGCCLMGIGSCFVAVGLTVGWAVIVASPQIVVPVCIAVGLVYGLWKFVILFKKDLPNTVRIGSNGAGNSALADPELGVGLPIACLVSAVTSVAAGAYGDKEAIEKNTQIEELSQQIYYSSVNLGGSTA
tara:strand:- start:63 stop:1814 length:1752 start_codon:yes stop_codon:yes gene_type:complete